jgi:MFS family permease
MATPNPPAPNPRPRVAPAGGVDPSVRLFRAYAGLVFSFAWVPVMYTAFTIDRGFDTRQYLELWSVYYLAMVVAEMPWGWIADHVGQRPLLVAGPLVLAGGFLLLGHSDSYEACLVAMGVTGAAHAMISGADSAYLYEVVVSRGRRREALHEEAVAHRWRLFGVSAADLAGGFTAFLFGTAAAFDLSVAIMVAAAAVAWRLPRVDQRLIERVKPSWKAIGRQLGRADVLWVVAWYTTVFVFLRLGFQLYQPTLLAVGAHDLRIHGGMLCLLNLVAGLAAIYVARLHGRLRERGTTCLVILLMTASFAGLSTLTATSLTPLFCLQQVSFGFLQPVGRTALNHRVSSAERASMLSAQSMLARLSFGALMWLLSTAQWKQPPEDGLAPIYGMLAGIGLGAAVMLFVTHGLLTRRAGGDPAGIED